MSRPAPTIQAVTAVTAMELRLALRRGENLLVTAVVPAAVLLFFATAVPLAVPGRPVDFLLPGAVSLGVIATSLVSLGIGTAYERHYGVLKRLAGSPIDRWAILVAKGSSVVVVEAVQVALLVVIGMAALGWAPEPGWSPGLAVVAIGLGTLAFAGIGLTIAGRLRAEATLAIANGLFLVCLLLGGIVVPVDHLPPGLASVATVLPAAALSDSLRAALEGGWSGSLVVLAAWAVGATAVATRTFRWE